MSHVTREPQGPSRVPIYWLAYQALAVAVIAAIVGFGAVKPDIWAPIGIFLLAAFIFLCLWHARHSKPLLWHPILAPTAGFGLLVGLQWLFHLSAYRGATLSSLAQLAGLAAALYLSLFAFRRRSVLQSLPRLAWWLTLGLSLEAILQYFTAGGYIYWYRDATYGTPFGPFIYHNHFAGCLVLLVPLATYSAFKKTGPHHHPPVPLLMKVLVPSLGVAAVVASRSRGGLIILVLEALAALFLFRSRRRPFQWKQAVLVVAASLTVLLAANTAPIVQRFLTLSKSDVSAADRWHFAQGCLAIWRAHPWLGSGFGTFASVYPQFEQVDIGQTVLYAHNEYAQLLAETGLAGAALAMWYGLVLGQQAGVVLRRTADPVSPLRMALTISLGGFLAYSVLDFQFHCTANALLFYVLTGALVASPVTPARSSMEGMDLRRARPISPGVIA